MNRLKKIKNYFQREWIDFLIFGISVIAIVSALTMVIQIKNIKAEMAKMKTEIVEIAEEQDRLETFAIEQSERLNSFQAEYEETAETIVGFERDIPLSLELQEYTYYICNAYDVDYDIVLAIMQVESGFTNVISKSGNDFGICQINKVNHEWLDTQYGLNNMLDERQNIKACVIILSDIKKNEYFDTNDKILMAYNMGQSGAIKAIESGTLSTEYTLKVNKAIEEIRK